MFISDDIREEYVSYLTENGPSPVQDFYTESPPRRADGIGVLKVSLGGHGNSQSGSGKSIKIAYLKNKHSKETIVKRWFDANKGKLSANSDRSIYINFPEAYRDELKKYVNIDWNSGDGGSGRGTCDRCGGTYDNSLAFHIRNNCTEV